MHVPSDINVDGLRGHDGLHMTSEDASDLKINFSGLKSLWTAYTGSDNETPHTKWREIDLQPSC